jgi:hypothetical protein
VIECRGPEGKTFGLGGLRQAILEAAPRGPEAVLRHALAKLDTFRGDVPAGDDVTAIIAEVR